MSAVDGLQYEVRELCAEVDSHHRDFDKIRAACDAYVEMELDEREFYMAVRNIVG